MLKNPIMKALRPPLQPKKFREREAVILISTSIEEITSSVMVNDGRAAVEAVAGVKDTNPEEEVNKRLVMKTMDLVALKEMRHEALRDLQNPLLARMHHAVRLLSFVIGPLLPFQPRLSLLRLH